MYKFLEKKFAYVTVLLILISAILHGLTRSLEIPTFHLDGAFQTASSLFRLDAGQLHGKDFFSYLGAGVLYVLFPFFKLAGSDLAASGFAAFLLCSIATFFSLYLIFLFLGTEDRLTEPLILASIFVFYFYCFYSYLPGKYLERLEPANSLRPIRSFAPYLFFGFSYLAYKKVASYYGRYATVAVIAAASFFWSNDYGIPTSSMILLASAIYAYRQGALTLKLFFMTLFFYVLSWFVFLYLASSGNIQEYLHFNFINVGKDQYWYYGPWLESSRVLSFADMFFKVLPETKIWTLVPLLFVFKLKKKNSLEITYLLFIGLSLYLGALLATVGGHLGYYFKGYLFWAKMITYYYVAYVLFSFLSSKWKGKNLVPWNINKRLCIMLVLLSTFIFKGLDYANTKNNYKDNPNYSFNRALGGFLDSRWKNHIELAQKNADSPFIEEYWGLWGASLKKFGDARVDSVIHALGSERDAFENIMGTGPEVVVTSTKDLAKEWLAWNLSANWWFYKHLLASYKPQKTSPTTLVWTKTSLRTFKEATCEIYDNNVNVIGEEGIYEVTLYYNLDGLSKRALAMIRNNLNYAAEEVGYLSLNKTSKVMSFPALARKNQPLDILIRSSNKDSEKAELNSCTARFLGNTLDMII